MTDTEPTTKPKVRNKATSAIARWDRSANFLIREIMITPDATSAADGQLPPNYRMGETELKDESEGESGYC